MEWPSHTHGGMSLYLLRIRWMGSVAHPRYNGTASFSLDFSTGFFHNNNAKKPRRLAKPKFQFRGCCIFSQPFFWISLHFPLTFFSPAKGESHFRQWNLNEFLNRLQSQSLLLFSLLTLKKEPIARKKKKKLIP